MADIKDKISQHNAQVYLDIAKDMLKQKQGVFTFVLRVNGKHIVDYVSYESDEYGRQNN